MGDRQFGTTRLRGPSRAAWLVIAIASASCGPSADDPICGARQALQDAVASVDRADAAERAGDAASTRAAIDEAARLIGLARTRLRAAPGETAMERRLLEAAEYLDFVVGEFRTTGMVDGSISQFASREINRAPAPGERQASC